MVLLSTQHIEWVEEAVAGTNPDYPTMLSFGYVESFEPTIEQLYEEVNYLPIQNASLPNRIGTRENIFYGVEDVSGSIEDTPTGIKFLQTCVMGNDSRTNDSIHSFTIGETNNLSTTSYRVYTGCTVDSYSIKFEQDAKVTESIEFQAMNVSNFGTTTYANNLSGASHSANPTAGTAMTWKNISGITWGGSAFSGVTVNSFTMDIDFDLFRVKDYNSSQSTKTSAIVPTKRDIKVTLGVIYDSVTTMEQVRNNSIGDLVFGLEDSNSSSFVFTVSDVCFAETPYTLEAGSVLSDDLESLSCTALNLSLA